VIISRCQQPVNFNAVRQALPEKGVRKMAKAANDLKLFKISGFFVKDFYLIATDEEQAGQEARRALSFRITECKADETDLKASFWKQLFGL